MEGPILSSYYFEDAMFGCEMSDPYEVPRLDDGNWPGKIPVSCPAQCYLPKSYEEPHPPLGKNNESPSADVNVSNSNGFRTLSGFTSMTAPSHAPTFENPTAQQLSIAYQKALRKGDPLSCLPRHVRDRIYTHLLNANPELRYIEVPDVLDPAFPVFASFSDEWYTEACQLMIHRATFSISTDCAIFNLICFLDEFEPHEGYQKVTALEFTSLSLLEKGTFTANSTKLLRRCPNLRHLTLLVDLRDLLWAAD
jgi:hypothetical protein